jgi:hypothetical protein
MLTTQRLFILQECIDIMVHIDVHEEHQMTINWRDGNSTIRFDVRPPGII